jgi:hypothetical protein
MFPLGTRDQDGDVGAIAAATTTSRTKRAQCWIMCARKGPTLTQVPVTSLSGLCRSEL